MIAIIDYGVGNIESVKNAFDRLSVKTILTSDPNIINSASHIILPGVGAFSDAINNLNNSGLVDIIKKNTEAGKPILGICLGMQMLFEKSYEDGEFSGLGLISGEILKFNLENKALKVPHMGWNKLEKNRDDSICNGITEDDYVYFVHSYYAVPKNFDNVIYYSNYEVKVPAIVKNKNVYGMQFHPEKSSLIGETLIKNFINIK